MTIIKYLPGTAFDPEAINSMVKALEKCRTSLDLRDPNDPIVDVVVQNIISLVSGGIADPDEIERRIVAEWLRDV